MPSERLKRPPPLLRIDAVIQPQFTQLFAPMGVGHGGSKPQPGALAGGHFGYTTQYVVTVNPIKEPPKPIVVSLAQPVSVAGWRRNVHTWMGTPYLQRGGIQQLVHHAGKMGFRREERNKMRGTYARGWTYKVPQPDLGPGPRVAPTSRFTNVVRG